MGGIAAAAALVLWAQEHERLPARQLAYEMRSALPRETSPAQYQQVDQREL